jgi:tetratricopeptide (TPR) repeat protein
LYPNSLQVAPTLGNPAPVAKEWGDLARAEQSSQQALAICETLAPNSLDVAATLWKLAATARQRKNYLQAQQYLARALAIYETQRYTLQDPETRTTFAERYFNAYTLQAQLALDQQRPQQAALALNHLPRGALVVAVDEQQRPTHWIERVAIGVAPSVGVYRQARATRPATRGVAIAAVSQYQRQQVAQASTVAQLVRRSDTALDNLPAVKQEVAQLQREPGKQGVVIAQGSNATPARARQVAQTARVAHFACHARADNVDPLESGLPLAPAGSDAGLLTAADVVRGWRLQADVVMLSACATAVGVARRYEGLYGLARAFLFAGARSVGASLWQVSDASTARLTGTFYRDYARGVGKAEALRQAQLALSQDKRYADPYSGRGLC